jgi:hypothetical protein
MSVFQIGENISFPISTDPSSRADRVPHLSKRQLALCECALLKALSLPLLSTSRKSIFKPFGSFSEMSLPHRNSLRMVKAMIMMMTLRVAQCQAASYCKLISDAHGS